MYERTGLEGESNELLTITSDIVSAHVSNNTVSVADLPSLIEQVYHTLAAMRRGLNGNNERPEPAVGIRKSITPDHLICLEDGKKLKMLKRHLKTSYNLTPDEYRARWSLPSNYPMVAPNYAKQRSKLAKAIGLGTRPRRNNSV